MASGWLTQWQIEHSLQLRGCHNLDKTVPGYRGNTAGYGITSQAYTAIQYSCKDVPNKQGSSRSNGPWGEIEPIVFPMRPTTKNVRGKQRRPKSANANSSSRRTDEKGHSNIISFSKDSRKNNLMDGGDALRANYSHAHLEAHLHKKDPHRAQALRILSVGSVGRLKAVQAAHAKANGYLRRPKSAPFQRKKGENKLTYQNRLVEYSFEEIADLPRRDEINAWSKRVNDELIRMIKVQHPPKSSEETIKEQAAVTETEEPTAADAEVQSAAENIKKQKKKTFAEKRAEVERRRKNAAAEERTKRLLSENNRHGALLAKKKTVETRKLKSETKPHFSTTAKDVNSRSIKEKCTDILEEKEIAVDEISKPPELKIDSHQESAMKNIKISSSSAPDFFHTKNAEISVPPGQIFVTDDDSIRKGTKDTKHRWITSLIDTYISTGINAIISSHDDSSRVQSSSVPLTYHTKGRKEDLFHRTSVTNSQVQTRISQDRGAQIMHKNDPGKEGEGGVKAAQVLQSHKRGRADRERVKNIKEEKQHECAALVLQSRVRGRADRKQVSKIKEQNEQNAAAQVLQTRVRGRAAIKQTKNLKRERSNMTSRKYVSESNEVNSAAIITSPSNHLEVWSQMKYARPPSPEEFAVATSTVDAALKNAIESFHVSEVVVFDDRSKIDATSTKKPPFDELSVASIMVNNAVVDALESLSPTERLFSAVIE